MDIFDAENQFYRDCDVSRISKFVAHAKLYEMSIGVPGDFVELGVFKGASFCRFRKISELYHPPHARHFHGFDVFDKFPDADHEMDRAELERQFDTDGDTSISVEALQETLDKQNLSENVTLVKGDIRETLGKYFEENDDRAIAIANIDLDLYGPVKTALEVIYPRVPKGGVIILDDYAAGFPGARKAVDEFLKENNLPETIQKFPWTHTPCFIIKE